MAEVALDMRNLPMGGADRLSRPASGWNESAMTARLMADTTVDVDGGGHVSKETSGWLSNTYRAIVAGVTGGLSRRGLYTERVAERLEVEPIRPDNGVIGGYTDGSKAVINSYVLPGTGHYGKFREWIQGLPRTMRDAFHARYGTEERARSEALHTMTHEYLHEATQLRPMAVEGGKRTGVFVYDLFNTLVDRYASKLPQGWKKAAPWLASMAYRPMAEGLNEVATAQALRGETAYQVAEERKKGPFSYDAFATAAAESLKKLGTSAMGFYREWADRGREAINRYADGFFEGMRTYQQQQAAPAGAYRVSFDSAVGAYTPSMGAGSGYGCGTCMRPACAIARA